MAEQFRQVLEVAFQVLGQDDAQKLADALNAVGDAGGDADGKLSPLVGQLEELGAQSAKVAQALDISDRLRANDAALVDAKANLAALNAEFSRTDKSSVELQIAFEQAEKRVRSLAAEQLKLQTASASSTDALKAAGVDTSNLAAANDQLKSKAAGLADQIKQQAAGLKDLGKGAHETAAGFQEVAEKSPLLRRVIDTLKDLAAAAGALFALDKAKDLIGDILAEGDKAEKFGQQFRDAFGGIEQGAEALTRVREIADQVPLSLDDVQAAAIRAKKQGLDPFNGTLLALIQSNAKFGGDVNSLNGAIDTLGKAYAKGALSAKDLLALQQQGIPAAKLLGDAIGRSSDEVLRLAQSGQLGRQSVTTLIDAMSKAGTAGAADQLGFLSTITTKLRDQWEDFLGLIADSGAYDFVRNQLQGLNDAIRKGIADGSLKQTAQSVSDAIVGLGRAIVGVTKFAYDHAAAIGTAVRGYVLFRTTLLALDLAAAAGKMLALAKATTAAGAAAEGAAATGGAFGKLGAAIGKIPRGIQIAVAVAGIDYILGKLEELNAASEENNALQVKLRQDEAETATQREQIAAKAAVLVDRLREFADVQIAGADELKSKSEDQSRAYVDQLQNAIRYYAALRVQAQGAGDANAASAATAKLRELNAALAAAKTQYDQVSAAATETSKVVSDLVDRMLRLKLQGADTAAALQGAFENIDLRTPQGIDDTIAILRTVAPVSKEASDALGSQLTDALKKLDAADLRRFTQNVTDQLAGAKGKADELRIALDSALSASLQKLGLSAEQAGQRVSDAGREMIDTFADVADSSQASANQIQLAFAQALTKASTSGEVEALRTKLAGLFSAGRISAEQFGVASEAAGRKLTEIQVAATTASAGLDGVGKSGETAGQRIVASLEDARHQLALQETDLAGQVTAALSAGDKALADSLNAQTKSVSKQIEGLNAEIDKVQSKSVTPDFSAASQGARQLQTDIRSAGGAIGDLAEKSKQGGKEMSDAFAQVSSIYAGFTAQFNGTSQNAALRFQELTKAIFEFGVSSNTFVQADVTGLAKLGEAVTLASRQTQKEIDEQKQGVASLAAQYQGLSDAAIRAMAQGTGSIEGVTVALQAQAAAAREGESGFQLLGAADLSPLASALEGVAQRARQLAEQAESARQSFADMASSLDEQIAQKQGDLARAEDVRFQNALEQLRKQAEETGTLSSAEYAAAVARTTQLHQINLKQIQDEAAAKKQADDEAAARKKQQEAKPTASAAPAPATQEHELKVTVSGKDLGGLDLNNQATLRALAQKLIPEIIRQLQAMAKNIPTRGLSR